MSATISNKFHNTKHNHDSCISTAIDKAQAICDENNIRFTPLRQRILELIWSNHKPVLAYDLLKILRSQKHNAEPPTVYRALDFLLENQLIHKIESLNAYVGCNFPDRIHISQFLICSECNHFVELDEPAIKQAVTRQANKRGFVIDHQTIEILGLCPTCALNANPG